MKSLTAVCQTGASMPAMKPQSGRVQRPPQQRTNGENAEMRMYLSKLKDLVPFMPKNRKLSKLEIIQHVIDYICELQTELESHPDIDSYDGARELLATPNRHFAALDVVNSVVNGSGGDIEQEEEADDEDEQDMDSNIDIAERLAADAANLQQQLQQHQLQQQQLQHQHQQQLQQSSPAARQPLVDRNAPNTFLPAAMLQLQQTTATVVATAAAAVAATVTATATTTAPATQQQQQQQQSTLMVTTEKEQSRRNC